jgi:hypothetical protein
LLSLIKEYVKILNRSGLAFSVRQVEGKVTVYFNEIEIAWVDTETRQYYNPPTLKIPITIPDPPDEATKNNILNSLFGSAVAIKVFGDEWREVHFILILNAVRDWAIIPKNPDKDPFVISVPPLGLWSGSEPVRLKLIIYPYPNEEPKIIEFRASELPDIYEIRRVVALLRL